MEMTKHLKTRARNIIRFIKRHPTSILGLFFLTLTLLPSLGFCDINSAFGETKTQVESIVSNRSGLFWIFRL